MNQCKDMEMIAIISLLSYILLSSAETIVFDVLTNNTNDIVIAGQQSINQLNDAQSKVVFKIYSHDISQVQNNLAAYGNDLLSRNASLVFDVTGTKKVSKYVGGILNIPVFGIWNHACMHCERDLHSHIRHNYVSMLPNKAYTASLITNLLMKLQWNPVGIIYQSHREADLYVLLKAFSGKILDQSVVAVNCKKNGSIETYSHKNLKKLVDTKPSAIVIIYDEHDLQHLMDFMKSDAVGLKAVHMNYIIFDPIESYTLKAENVYTIVSLQVDMQNNAEMLSLTTAVNSASHSGKLIAEHVLLYDAIKSAGNVIAQLVQNKRWNDTSGNALADHHKRTSNALEFFRELELFKHSGLTGNIEFSNESYRQNMSFQILNLQENTFKKIGRISEDGTISLTEQPKTNFKLESQFLINGHLNIVTIVEEPYTMKKTSGNGTTVYYGFLVDIVEELAKVANFTYSFYEVADNQYGYVDNGVWKGMVGDVLYKKADMAMAPLTITSTRQGVVQFTTPYLEVTIVVVRKKAETAVFNLMLFMEPFTSHVWLLILGACIVVGIVLYSVDYFSPFGWRQTGESATGQPGTEFDISNSIWFSMASILLQGGDNTPRSFSGRILVGMFWFYVLILTSSYTANLAAYFTSTKANDENTDLETLLKSGHSFTIIETFALEQYLKNSDYKIYKRVHERMVLQNTLAKNMGESLKLVRADPNMYYLEEKPFVQWVANKEPCDLKAVDATIQESGFGMPVSLDSPYAGAISHGISKIRESGYIAARRKHYWDTLNACKTMEDVTHGITTDGRLEPLQMLGVYAFLIGGIVISVITMLAEIWWKKKVEERATRVKAKFRQSFRNAIAQKKGTSTAVQRIAIRSRNPTATLQIAVGDLMKEKGEKSM